MPNTATVYNNSSTSNQSNRTPYYNIKTLSGISDASKVLYIELRRLAGINGYTSRSVRELAYFVGKSKRTVSRLVGELETNGLIEIWAHNGFENEYVIPDVYFSHTHDKTVTTFNLKTSKELTVSQKPNVVSICPTQNQESTQAQALKITSMPIQEVKNNFPEEHYSPIRMDLVQEIVSITNDTKSTRFWIKFVRQAPLAIVYAAIASLRISLETESVYHPGRYMVGIIKRVYPELFENQKQPLRPSEHIPDASYYPKWSENKPDIVRDWDMNMEQIRLIKAKLAL